MNPPIDDNKPGDLDGQGDDAIEQRLASYGDVLREELAGVGDRRDEAVADTDGEAKIIPIGAAAVDEPTRSLSRLPIVRVAAAIMLVAVGLIGFRALSSPSVDVALEVTDATDDADAEAESDEGESDEADGEADGLAAATATPAPSATARPSATPVSSPTQHPSATPAPSATAGSEPTPRVATAPSGDPTATSQPTATPTPQPAGTVTPGPNSIPSPTPTSEPTPTSTSTPVASADAPGLSCARGQLVGNECVITTDPSSTPRCPEGPNMSEENGRCYQDLDRPSTCLDPLDQGDCLRRVASLPGGECPAGATLTSADLCRSSESANFSCDDGTLVRGDEPTCRIERTPSVGADQCPAEYGSGSPRCYEVVPVSCGGDLFDDPGGDGCRRGAPITEHLTCFGDWPDTEITPDGDCVQMEFGTESCPADAIDIAGFTCFFYEPAANDETPITCPDGWYVVGHPVTNVDGCGRDEQVTVTCPAGFSPNGVECERRVPAQVMVKVCSLNGRTIDSQEECTIPASGECPAGMPEVAGGCKSEVAMVPECRTGEQLNSSDRCVRTTAPVATCPSGQELRVVSNGPAQCISEVPVPGGSGGCRIGGDVVEVDGSCYQPMDQRSRIEVPRVPGEAECPAGYTLLEPTTGRPICERRVPAE